MSISKKFMAAVLGGFIATAGMTSGVEAQQQQQVDPITALNHSPTCIAFGHEDRDGLKFNEPELSQYDSLLGKYAEELEAYSGWPALKAQMARLRFPSFGVCAYNHGSDDGPVALDKTTGTIDLNLHKSTPWGSTLSTPQEIEANLDEKLHYTIYTLTGEDGIATGVVSKTLELETYAFVRAIVQANAHAEAILFSFERGIRNGNLDEIATVIYDNSPMVPDQISELYLKAVEGPLSDADKKAFKENVITAFLMNDQIRAGIIGGTLQEAQNLGPNIMHLYNANPPEEQVLELLENRLGVEVSKMQIDGQSLLSGYKAHYAADPNDPGTKMIQGFGELRKQIGAMLQQMQAGPQGQAPAAPATPVPDAVPAPAPAQ